MSKKTSSTNDLSKVLAASITVAQAKRMKANAAATLAAKPKKKIKFPKKTAAPAAKKPSAPKAPVSAIAASNLDATDRAELEALRAAVAASQAGKRREEIVKGVLDANGRPAIADVARNDWRLAHQGKDLRLTQWERKPGDDSSFRTFAGSEWTYFAAIPRDSDGSYGAMARAAGELALHHTPDESGRFTRTEYVTQQEFAQIFHG